MADLARARKLGERIQVIVAEAVEMRVKDPRLGFVTITDVRLSPDLHDATVFYTVYGTEEEAEDTGAALNSARGMIRTEVGRRTGVKFTPSITFIRDALPETSKNIDELLSKAAAADAQVHEIAAKATFAGDADPYKSPSVDAD